MNFGTHTTRARLNSAVLALLLGPAASLPAFAEEAVFVTGYTLSSETPPEFPVSPDEMAMFGQAADIGLSMAMHKLGIDPGTQEYEDITGAVDEFFDGIRPQDRTTERTSFSALYQSCRMIFSAPPNIMSIRLPPGSSMAYMEGYDWSKREGFSVELNRDLSATQPALGAGWTGGMNMSATGATDTMLGYEVQEYTFDSDGGLGNQGQAATSVQQAAGPGGLASMVSVSTSGRAWVTDEIEGWELIRTFYENLASQIASSQGQNSFYGGLMKNLVGQLENGLPLYTSQQTESKVMGKTTMAGESESWVTSVRPYDRDEAECSVSVLPPPEEGYEIMRMGAGGFGSSGAPGGAPGAPGSSGGPGTAGAPGSSGQGGALNQPCDCSCEAFDRLQQQGEARGDGGPEDQAMAMCMMQCMQQFMGCAMQRR